MHWILWKAPTRCNYPLTFPPAAIVSLRAHNGTPGLVYTTDEFGLLCKAFVEYCRIPIDDRSANYIFHMTDGHPGLSGFILRSVYEHRSAFSLEGTIILHTLYPYISLTFA
jgi:hypothetical protein